jgi:hypothetical protein
MTQQISSALMASNKLPISGLPVSDTQLLR